MKYFLTQDLYQEMQLMGGSSPFFHIQNYRGPVLDLDECIDYIDMFEIMYSTVRKLYMDSNLNYGDEFIIRYFNYRQYGKHFLPENHISLKNPRPPINGCWEYTFAKIAKSCLYVSSIHYSNFVNSDGTYNIKESDGTIINASLSDIASSTDKIYFDAFMPPNKDMFAVENVRYIIPVQLLTQN